MLKTISTYLCRALRSQDYVTRRLYLARGSPTRGKFQTISGRLVSTNDLSPYRDSGQICPHRQSATDKLNGAERVAGSWPVPRCSSTALPVGGATYTMTLLMRGMQAPSAGGKKGMIQGWSWLAKCRGMQRMQFHNFIIDF